MSFQVRHKRKLIVSILFAVVGYAAWVIANEAEAVFASATRAGLPTLAFVCALSLFNYLVRFGRWHWYLSSMRHRVALLEHLRIYLSGFALTTTPGKTGEAIRSLFLKEHGVPYTTSLAALGAERLADVISVSLIAAGGFVFFPQYSAVALLLLFGSAMVVATLQFRALRERLHRLVRACFRGRLLRAAEYVVSLLDRVSELTGAKGTLVGVFLGLLAWGAEAFAFWCLVLALGYQLPLLLVASVYALSTLAGAVSSLPGGLGGAEAAMGLMLLALGLSGPDAVSATLLCRLATLWLAVAIGAIALGRQHAAARRAHEVQTEDVPAGQ